MSTSAHPRPNYGAIFVALFALTIVEIFATKLPVAKIFIVFSLIGLAVLKAALVAMFYMHLRFEKILLTVICLSPLIFSVILTLLVGFDIGHARP